MPSSYRIINYALRPAKAIERRMLCAAFERLYPFQRIERYRYVGFGSIYFSDFQLLHRELGITNMLSIEKDVEAEACFRFNRPYKCIRLKFATSTGVLPTLDWNKKTILWLDYDDRLNTSILGDIATTCLRASSGSLVVVSVNAQPDAGCGSVSPPAVDAHRDGALTRSRDGCATGIARSPRRLSFHSTGNSGEPAVFV